MTIQPRSASARARSPGLGVERRRRGECRARPKIVTLGDADVAGANIANAARISLSAPAVIFRSSRSTSSPASPIAAAEDVPQHVRGSPRASDLLEEAPWMQVVVATAAHQARTGRP